MAQHRHKREPNARRFAGVAMPQLPHLRPTLLAAPLAVVATAGAISFGVLAAEGGTVQVAAPSTPEPAVAEAPAASTLRGSTLSRGLSEGRGLARDTPSEAPAEARSQPARSAPTHLERLLAPYATRKAIAAADTRLWTTEPLNLWTSPEKAARQTGTVEAGQRVLVTGRELADRVEIVWKGSSTRWVSAGYLTDTEPATLGGDCTNGTSVPDGVAENVKKVHAAVCAAFPDITTYGTFRNDGEHSQGLAVDIMVSGDRGTEIADFVRENAADLGVNYVIWAQEIWSVERGGEGWRGMEDRGSVTANHFDHVHVTVF